MDTGKDKKESLKPLREAFDAKVAGHRYLAGRKKKKKGDLTAPASKKGEGKHQHVW